MVFNYTSFYYFWCRNINRRRNSLVWNCCYSNFPQVGLEELPAVTREDSNFNDFKQDCFYLKFSFCTNTLLLFIQKISIFDFIFSSSVSFHIMMFNYTSYYFFGAETLIEEETVWFEIVAIQIFPKWVWKSYLLLQGKIRMSTISYKITSTSNSVSAPTLYSYSYKIFSFLILSSPF